LLKSKLKCLVVLYQNLHHLVHLLKRNKMADKKWIQKATASIKRRGTEGVCTGSKFGGPTCRPGTKRYNLAKTFRAMSKKK